MKIPNFQTIKTAGDAEQLAINWQNWQSEQSLSYGELADWAVLFRALGRKFGLTDEFKENGIL